MLKQIADFASPGNSGKPTAAVLKRSPPLFPFPVWRRLQCARPEKEKREVGWGIFLPRAAASAALPWADMKRRRWRLTPGQTRVRPINLSRYRSARWADILLRFQGAGKARRPGGSRAGLAIALPHESHDDDVEMDRATV